MQTASRTVEGELIETCMRLSLFSDWRKAGFQSAGRTDRGVHARGQIIAFTTDSPDRAVATINLQLPPDLWCTAYAVVSPAFHPRFDARSRTYRYYFSDAPRNRQALEDAARQFPGTHDFSNFARVRDKNPLRTVLASRIGEEDGFVFFEVTAESFLWHQVRCMATALIRAGNDEIRTDSILRYLEGEIDKPLSPAPAEGLVLWDTDCGLAWQTLEAGDRSRAFLEHLRRHHALMERICTVLK
jgi:tRNA pseudouridine38-40 synthase